MTAPPTTLETDLCVIGGGSGGLSVAAGASQMGARVVLVEHNRMGGDCLNSGCVPSKALLAAAHQVAEGRRQDRGVVFPAPHVDMAAVHAHVHGVIAAIEPHDSVERFEALGVQVLQEHGVFTGPHTLACGDTTVKAKFFVIATGSSAACPPIPGLEDVPYLTNQTVFDLQAPVDSLIIIGGGPIGCELAQAHRRLGAKVVVLEADRALRLDDPECSQMVLQTLRQEGVEIHEGTGVTGVRKTKDGLEVLTETHTFQGSHLLVATGRVPNCTDLGLEKAGVRYDRRGGIAVDARLRTSNPRIYAIGDVAGGPQFTHVAGYHAGVVIRNVLFWIPAKVDLKALPAVTYTDPELAHTGLREHDLEGQDIRILRWGFDENDRARTERVTCGLIKVITSPKGRILGCTIVGPRAGDLLAPWILAIERNLKIGAMAQTLLPYPTLGEVSKRAAGSFYTPQLFSERTRKLVRFLLKWR